jgi:hypothetical protein
MRFIPASGSLGRNVESGDQRMSVRTRSDVATPWGVAGRKCAVDSLVWTDVAGSRQTSFQRAQVSKVMS